MSRPAFDATLINTLRDKVARHNDQVPPDGKVRLADLKRRYSSYHQGENPHENALAKIDSWLGEKLEKAAGYDASKHPRARGGKFAAKGGKAGQEGQGGDDLGEATPVDVHSISLPALTQDQHHELQQSNPAYRAITSDIIPDQRHILLGSVARVSGSLLAGTALATAAYHGKTGNWFASKIAGGAAKAGSTIAGTVAHATGHAATDAGHKVASMIAKARKMPAPASPSYARSDRVAAAAAKIGGKVAGVPGRVAGHTVPAVLRGAVKFGHSRLKPIGADATKAQALAYAARKRAITVGIVGGAGLATGAAINNAISGSVADPEVLGRAYDYDSYRTIEKMMGGIDLDAAYQYFRGEMAADGALEKSAANFLHDVKWQGIAGTVAGLGGAALGGGAGYGASRAVGDRQYYRDSHGKFSSRDHAVAGAGAALGGIAGAAAAVLAIRSHNASRFVDVARAVLARSRTKAATISTAVGRKITNNGPGHVMAVYGDNGLALNMRDPGAEGHLARKLATRELDVAELAAKDPVARAGLDELDRYGAASPGHYQDAVRHALHNHMANYLMTHDKFVLPKVGKGGTMSVADMRAAKMTTADIHDAIMPELARMSADSPAWKKAIAGLSDEQQARYTELLGRREALVGDVTDQLSKHGDKIDRAAAKVDALREDVTAAKRVEDDAKAGEAAVGGLDDEAKSAAKAAHTAARTKRIDAEEAVTKAESTHQRLMGGAKPVYPIGPSEGSPIPAPNVPRARQRLLDAAEEKAAKKVDLAIEGARTAALEHNLRHHDRLLAAVANLGGGAAPRGLRSATAKVDQARAELVDAVRGHNDAVSARAAADATVKRLKAAKKGVAGKTPQAKQEAADLLAREDAVVSHHLDTQLAAEKAEQRLNRAHHDLGTARAEFDDALRASGQSNTPRRIPIIVGTRLSRSFRRAAQGPRKAVHAFLASPTAANLARFAHTGASYGRAAATRVSTAARASAEHAVMTNGSFDALKTARAVSLLGGGAALTDFGHDFYGYARDRVVGPKDKRSKATFPKQVKLDHHVDPFTGAGWTTLSLPDHENKADRVVLFGEQFDSHTSKPNPIFAGSKLSAVRSTYSARQAQMQNRGMQGGGGPRSNLDPGAIDIPSLPEADRNTINGAVSQLRSGGQLHRTDLPSGGGAQEFRREGDSQHDNAANALYRNAQVKGDSPVKRPYYDALTKVTYSRQSPVLKASAAYGLVTGYRPDGSKLGHGSVFKQDPRFGSSDRGQVAAALNDEVNRAVDSHGLFTDHQRAALLRAAYLVRAQNGLDGQAIQPAISKIMSSPLRGGASQGNAAPAGGAPGGAQASAKPPRANRLSMEMDFKEGPHQDWDTKAFRSKANVIAADISTEHLGFKKATDAPHVQAFVEQAARAVSSKYPEFDMDQTLGVVYNAIRRHTANNPGGREDMKDAVQDGDFHPLLPILDAEAHRQLDRLNKMDGPDLLETLEKGFADALSRVFNRVPAGGAGGGEFASGGAAGASGAGTGARAGAAGHGGAQQAGRELIDGASEFEAQQQKPDKFNNGNRKESETAPQQSQSFLSRSRLIPEVGSYLAGDTLSNVGALLLGGEGKIAGLALETIAPRLLGDSGGALAAKAVRWGVKGAAGNLTAQVGAKAGRKVFGALGEAVTGQKAVAPEMNAGEKAANAVGNIGGGFGGATAGSMAGEAVGGTLGATLGSAVAPGLGTVLGGVVGRGIGGFAGSVLGGSLGAWAGGHAAVGGYDAIAPSAQKWFSGYDSGHAQQVFNRYSLPAAAASAGNGLAGRMPKAPYPDAGAARPTLRPRGLSPAGVDA